MAAALHAVLAVLANPLDTRALQSAHSGLSELRESGPFYDAQPDETEETGRFRALLRSVHRPETLLFPREDEEIAAALPVGVATEDDVARLERLADFLRANFDPVSYTHLDVYKRQLFARPGLLYLFTARKLLTRRGVARLKGVGA